MIEECSCVFKYLHINILYEKVEAAFPQRVVTANHIKFYILYGNAVQFVSSDYL